MSKKRVFSNNNHINYQDYMNNKKGIAMIQNQKSIGRQRIQRFLSYQEFMILTRTFFLYSQKHRNLLKAPFTIYQATRSKVSFHKINEHIAACDFCLYARDPDDFLKCREIQNILYPYGHYMGESQEIYYPSTLDLTKWCHQCDDKMVLERDGEDGDNDFSDTFVKEKDDCIGCPHVDDNELNSITGHKPNCECCKRSTNNLKTYGMNKNNFGYKETGSEFGSGSCALCMNTKSLFLHR